MCVDLSLDFPLAAKAVEESFYVDDGLTGEEAIELHQQVQSFWFFAP